MPIAKFQLQDGRIGRFSVPDGTTPEQAQSMISDFVAGQHQPYDQSSIPTEPLAIGKDAFPEALKQVLADTDWGTRNIAGAGTALSDAYYGGKQLLGALYDKVRSPTMGELITGKQPTWNDKQAIENNKIIADSAPIGTLAGNVGLMAIPFAKAGKSLTGMAAVGGGYGSLQPVDNASSISDITTGKAINTGVGAATSLLGQWVSNSLLKGSANKLASIEQKVQDKAAQVAASETASARSAAGNAAQNAYRQLEHLRELGANRPLTDEESLIAQSLERELAEKALEKLVPAAALKQSTADAYAEAMKTEANRAAQYAADKLSGNEVKQQIMARLKRYGPAAVGGMAGNLIFPGLGGAVGGAATGLVLRPAIRSMVNLSKNPAVQHAVLSTVDKSPLLTYPAVPITSVLAGEGLLGR